MAHPERPELTNDLTMVRDFDLGIVATVDAVPKLDEPMRSAGSLSKGTRPAAGLAAREVVSRDVAFSPSSARTAPERRRWLLAPLVVVTAGGRAHVGDDVEAEAAPGRITGCGATCPRPHRPVRPVISVVGTGSQPSSVSAAVTAERRRFSTRVRAKTRPRSRGRG